ncbi:MULTISPECIES: CAP domain-containing protein [unclassified Streptomyces]|uniref:CAP domain-containing protein n=1 Tax=unclassified Streptomyces TaxID=2593676 RepID=UPI002DDB2433|nr:CAP domain-containing protein [Streptomyces sp. NBC_01750]WSB03077.1 CAP domain-containing protein [Streptomyces sp. NBC_01794]WSD32677.1 CAP domain-containing protein [Streptomyces sp. NBC_01750]
MSKHRKKTYYRKITIAAVAVGAVAVPSAAMACVDPQVDAGSQPHAHHWKGAKSEHRWTGHRWTGAPWGHRPTAGESKTPTGSPAAPKATATPSAPKTTAPKATASPSAPKATAPASGAAARVLQLVNSERGKVGCSALTMNAKLTKAALDHSKDMASHKNMSHTGSDGSSPGDRITSAGYSWSTYGENVAYGYATPESVMAGWMSSPGHKANILNCAFKEIGIGLAQPGDYWTQDFGTAR